MDDDPLLVTGWGDSRPWGCDSDELLQAEVNYVTKDECPPSAPGDITDGMVCAARDGKGVCYESGGPLMLDNADSNSPTNPVQVGIGIAFRDFCSAAAPGVYIRVSHYVEWIKKQTNCALNGAFCPCLGSGEYFMIHVDGEVPDTVSWDLKNTCGDVLTTIKKSGGPTFEAMCVPKGQYVFNIQVRVWDLSMSMQFHDYG